MHLKKGIFPFEVKYACCVVELVKKNSLSLQVLSVFIASKTCYYLIISILLFQGMVSQKVVFSSLAVSVAVAVAAIIYIIVDKTSKFALVLSLIKLEIVKHLHHISLLSCGILSKQFGC